MTSPPWHAARLDHPPWPPGHCPWTAPRSQRTGTAAELARLPAGRAGRSRAARPRRPALRRPPACAARGRAAAAWHPPTCWRGTLRQEGRGAGRLRGVQIAQRHLAHPHSCARCQPPAACRPMACPGAPPPNPPHPHPPTPSQHRPASSGGCSVGKSSRVSRQKDRPTVAHSRDAWPGGRSEGSAAERRPALACQSAVAGGQREGEGEGACGLAPMQRCARVPLVILLPCCRQAVARC